MQKIKVICKQFVSMFGGVDVNSLMYIDDTPLIGKDAKGGDYHLGQISSSFTWAKHDITDHFKERLDAMFPEGYEFYFEFITLDEVTNF